MLLSVRWGLVIHGAIDGYSRLIVFLKCSNNNRAATVFQLFEQAVAKLGLPYTGVLSLYYSLFLHLEECGVLNPLSTLDLICSSNNFYSTN